MVLESRTAELVSNAVRHTKGPAALRVRRSAGVLRIGAWDTDPGPPEPPGTLRRVAANTLRDSAASAWFATQSDGPV
ncbi:MAG: hypothetical protein ACJ736_07645 [Streptomyces sp.]